MRRLGGTMERGTDTWRSRGSSPGWPKRPTRSTFILHRCFAAGLERHDPQPLVSALAQGRARRLGFHHRHQLRDPEHTGAGRGPRYGPQPCCPSQVTGTGLASKEGFDRHHPSSSRGDLCLSSRQDGRSLFVAAQQGLTLYQVFFRSSEAILRSNRDFSPSAQAPLEGAEG